MSPAHIRVLLDADGMRPLLGTIPLLADGTARLTAVSLDRLWVKPGRHFHASYRVTLATAAHQWVRNSYSFRTVPGSG